MILDLFSSCDDVNKPSTKITLDSHHYLSLTFTLLHGICKEQRKEVFNLNSFVLVYPLFFNFFRTTVVKKRKKKKCSYRLRLHEWQMLFEIIEFESAILVHSMGIDSSDSSYEFMLIIPLALNF